MSWVFQPRDPMGGAAGEAYANTLKSPGMPPAHSLAREAIQNSVDAGLPGISKVLVKFRAAVMAGSDKTRFVRAAHLKDVAARMSVLELAGLNCLKRIGESNEPINVLFVEDYNTQGLSGAAHDKNSHFYRLLLSLGDRSKSRTEKGSGGSYGFGKSV